MNRQVHAVNGAFAFSLEIWQPNKFHDIEVVMKLYLVRHGEYVTKTDNLLDCLTDQGRRHVWQLVHWLKPLHLVVDRILHSDKNRAKETAEILSQAFTSKVGLTMEPRLSPNSEVQLFAHELEISQEDLVIVSHLPYVSKLTSLLLAGDEDMEMIEFTPGTILCLDFNAKQKWLLKWLIAPQLMA